MTASLETLLQACHAEPEMLQSQTQQQISLWENWLKPLNDTDPAGEDPSYDDDFQQIREEVNKLSGADTRLICQLAEKLLTTTSKDIRVATYYIWARLHSEGESGLAEGLALLAGLMQRFGQQLHPQRSRSRKAALEWLAGSRISGSLSLYPEVVQADALRTTGALLIIAQHCEQYDESERPVLDSLFTALENRLAQSGGSGAVVPQHASTTPAAHSGSGIPLITLITSGRDLLDQARLLTEYLRDQPDGWLAAHRLMKSVRHDTLHQLPPLDINGRTRLAAPKPEHRVVLKRLYKQQSWRELLEQADSLFSRGVNHLWLDLQWYIHQALLKAGAPYSQWAGIIVHDLYGVLIRLPGLETLAFNDGSPFADEATLNWISREVMGSSVSPGNHYDVMPDCGDTDDILQLEPDVLAVADSEGIQAALVWLQNRPGVITVRQRWLLKLLMARVAEQYSRNEIALHLLKELDSQALSLTMIQWEPVLLFEVRARRLKLLRMKAAYSETEKQCLLPEMEYLLAGLVMLDPVRAAVLCDQ